MSPHSRWMGSFIDMKVYMIKGTRYRTTAANRDDFFGDENNAIYRRFICWHIIRHTIVIWLVITSMQPHIINPKKE